jgi:hypothetical protein
MKVTDQASAASTTIASIPSPGMASIGKSYHSRFPGWRFRPSLRLVPLVMALPFKPILVTACIPAASRGASQCPKPPE